MAECYWVVKPRKFSLQGYEFKVVYQPGNTNIADALSRLNSMKQLDHGEEYDFIRAVVENCIRVALSLKEFEEASYGDEELCLVKNCVNLGTGNIVRSLQFICTHQRRIMHLWRAFVCWYKDSGTRGQTGT